MAAVVTGFYLEEPSSNWLSDTAGRDVFLDQDVTQLAANSWLVMSTAGSYAIYAVVDAASGTRADFAMTGKTIGVDLASVVVPAPNDDPSPPMLVDGVTLYVPPNKPEADDDDPLAFLLRSTIAFVLPLAQTLAPMPYVSPIEDPKTHLGASAITLDRMVLELAIGQPLMITGTEAGDTTTANAPTVVTRSEVATIARITHAAGRTTLCFAQPLAYRYVRSTCAINANVVFATNGASTTEVLGSGAAGAANQRFALKKTPLTYVPADTASGAASTLDVQVNGVSWTQVESLYSESPRSRSYLVRLADDGTATVEFGDGVRGARLPTGQENITANYRTGIGPAGDVRARTISLLLSAPLGVRSVVNPIAAAGGTAPEVLADARAHAPRTVLTLERVVSLADFSAFARSYAGIGKALAQTIWSGERRIVYLSAADSSGNELVDTLPPYTTLSSSLAELSDGTDEIQIGDIDPTSGQRRTFIQRLVNIAADVCVDTTYDTDTVLAEVTAALLAAFSFAARQLGQSLTEADVYVVIQQIAGVTFTRVTRLGDLAAPLLPANGVLVAARGTWSAADGWIRPAELLVVSPAGITLNPVLAKVAT